MSEWRKSSFCEASGCVWVRQEEGHILVSADPGAAPVLRFTRGEWDAFIAGVRNGDFDLTPSP